MKILVVDDDPAMRGLVKRTLTTLGHQVTEAEDGRQAWAEFVLDSFPLLISDWLMPEMDGLELTRLIRARDTSKYTYVILLTALEGKNRYLEGMNAGADDFITKPFDEDQLAARIRVAERILGLQARNRELTALIPICMYCKRVRDDTYTSYWQPMDAYLMRHTDTKLSHGICPECLQKHHPQMAERITSRPSER